MTKTYVHPKAPITMPYPPYRAFSEVGPLELPPQMQGELEYTGWRDEQLSWKTDCYIGDWSFVPQVRVKGPDALQLLSDLSVNSFKVWPEGRAKHCVQCNENGKVISEGVLLRYAEDDFEFECGTPLWTYFNAVKGGYDVEAEIRRTYKLQVSGPTSLALLEKLTGQTLSDVKFMYTRKAKIAGLDVLLLRQGMAGEVGFELHGPFEEHDIMLDTVFEAGKEFGIRRLGRRTFMVNHLEACFPTSALHFVNAMPIEKRAEYMQFIDSGLPPHLKDIPYFNGLRRYNLACAFTGSWNGSSTDELNRSPVEMGWSKVINFDHDFIGRSALEKEVAAPRRTVVTLEFNSDDMVKLYASLFRDGDTYPLLEIPHSNMQVSWVNLVQKDGKTVGHSTYPGYSYFFRKALSLSFLDVEFVTPGTEVRVLWGDPGTPQIELRATVKPAPYKQDDRRGDISKYQSK